MRLDLPESVAMLRSDIERSVPVGSGPGGEHRNIPDSIETHLQKSVEWKNEKLAKVTNIQPYSI